MTCLTLLHAVSRKQAACCRIIIAYFRIILGENYSAAIILAVIARVNAYRGNAMQFRYLRSAFKLRYECLFASWQ
jgi:hypothetical protein